MSDESLKFPAWQVPLQELILEFNSAKLPAKVQEVEKLIVDRLGKLRFEVNSDEYGALNDALSILRVLKRDRLGQGASS